MHIVEEKDVVYGVLTDDDVRETVPRCSLQVVRHAGKYWAIVLARSTKSESGFELDMMEMWLRA